jgi:hypothetical protein
MSRPEYLDKILTKEILKQSYDKLGSLNAVARQFGVDPGSIKKYMTRYGLDFKKQIIYNCDHKLFSRDDEVTLLIETKNG